MEHREGQFAGVGNLSLYYQCWRPEERTRAVLAIVHGLGEHSARYDNVVGSLVPRGYAVYGFDLRGHGRSPGKRGYINHLAEFRGDVGAFLDLVRTQEPAVPLFLMGHSLGGLIVLNYVLHDRPEGLSGIIASGPALAQTGISPFLMLLSRVLSRVLPDMSVKTGLDANAISRDPDVVKAYQDDELVHGLGTPRLGTEAAHAQTWTREHASDWTLPLLVLHGGDDEIIPPACSRAFFEQVPVGDKQRIEYEGGFHEPHNDVNHLQVTNDLESWLAAHLA
jgi:alpha-beta hydrolase superfamily lysophospholipase